MAAGGGGGGFGGGGGGGGGGVLNQDRKWHGEIRCGHFLIILGSISWMG
jgi:hypothetical protein